MKLGGSKIDTSAVRAGVWKEFVVGTPSGPERIRLKIALADASINETYKKALREAMDPFKRALALYQDASEIPEAMSHEINEIGRRVFCEQIVQDWDGIESDGKPVPYSAEGGIQLFEEYPELYANVEAEAGKHKSFRQAVLEDAAGN